jgi:hypothetical protein
MKLNLKMFKMILFPSVLKSNRKKGLYYNSVLKSLRNPPFNKTLYSTMIRAKLILKLQLNGMRVKNF